MARAVALVVLLLVVAMVLGGLAGGGVGLRGSVPSPTSASPAPSGMAGAAAAAPPIRPDAGGDWANATITTATFPAVVVPPVSLAYDLAWNSSYTYPYLEVTAVMNVFAGPNQVELAQSPLPPVPGPGRVSLGYGALAGNTPMPESMYRFNITITLLSPLGTTENRSNTVSISQLVVVNPSVVISNPVPVYTALPFTVDFSVGLDPANSGITASPANETVGIALLWPDGSCAEYLPAPYSVCLQWIPGTVINATTPGGTLPYNASGNYSFTFTAADLPALDYLDGALPTGQYAIAASITVSNSSNASFPARTVEATATSYVAWNPPAASFLRPLNNTTGLVAGQPATVVVEYSGDYVSAAFFNVTNATTGAAVFSQGIFQAGPGPHGTYAEWTPAAAGTFQLSVVLLTPYAPPFSASEVERVAASGAPGGGTSYVNTTYWHNATWFPGVSPAAGAALLLVVGLVVGMGIAWIVAQATTGRPPSTVAPAARSGPETAGRPNDCPVCGQSFPSGAEAAAHAKDSHGIG